MIEELKRQKRIHGLTEDVSAEEIKMLEDNVPVQKIIGFVNFDDVKINVNRNVLIPRYETEEVMKKALEFITSDSKVLDMCTGSGYIGLSIKMKTDAEVTMADISDEAILQSRENADINNLNVSIVKSDMFENIKGKFDLIISNPPYIPSKIKLDDSVLKHEPHNALFAGNDGNDFYKIIVDEAPKFLNENGTIVLEISEDNVSFINKSGFTIINDINEKPRIAYKKY